MNASKPAVSIIIPIYNVEEYLDRCLNSIKTQSFQDFEVIMINNGSVDKSGEIAQKYADEDNRFTVVHQENTGASKARNLAYSMSSGEYISFVDSDDYIAPDFLMQMYTAAKRSGADITVCNYALNFEPEKRIKKIPSKNLRAGEFSRDEAVSLLLKDTRLRFFVWNKLWKRELLEKTGTKFIDMFYEDVVFCVDNFLQINKLCSIDYIGNFYSRQTKTILEKKMTFKRINDYIESVRYVRELLEIDGSFEKFKKSFKIHAMHVWLSMPILVVQANHSAEQKVKTFRTVKQNWKKVSYYAGKSFRLENLPTKEGKSLCPTKNTR